jgi:hypothetical protein
MERSRGDLAGHLSREVFTSFLRNSARGQLPISDLLIKQK